MAIKEGTIQRLQEFIKSDKYNSLPVSTQERIQKVLSEQGISEPFVESKTPVLGARQVIPQSPVGFLGRLRLGFASPEGRKQALEKQFGTVEGVSGREFVPTKRGFQSVNPRGFDVGDIPEFTARIPGIIGQIGGAVAGGTLTSPSGAGIPFGATLGAGLGLAGGESLTRQIGRVIGVRPDDTVSKEIEKTIKDLALGGALELGAAGAVKVFPTIGGLTAKFGRGVGEITRRLGKAKKMTSEWFTQRVKDIGAKEVFRTEKLNPEYAGKILLPRVQDGIVNSLRNFGDDTVKLLKRFNVSDNTIRTLKNRGYDIIKKTQETFKNSTADISERLQGFLAKNLKSAGDNFDEFLNKQPEGTFISSNNFVNTMRKVFKKMGIMDMGNNFRNIDTKNIPSQLKTLMNVYNETIEGVVTEGGVRAKGKLLISDYFRLKGVLSGAVKGNAGDISLFESIGGLTDDAVKSIEGLGEKNITYSKAKSLYDDFMAENKTGENVLGRFRKLTEKQKLELKRLDKEMPFMKELEDLHTAKELDDLLEKEFSPQKIEGLFSQGGIETKVTARDTLKEIDDLLSNPYKFYNDYRDWLGQMDLQDAGVYATRGGVIRALSEEAERQYFKRIVPLVSKGQKIKTKYISPLSRVFEKTMETITEPTVAGKKIRTLPVLTRQFTRQEE